MINCPECVLRYCIFLQFLAYQPMSNGKSPPENSQASEIERTAIELDRAGDIEQATLWINLGKL